MRLADRVQLVDPVIPCAVSCCSSCSAFCCARLLFVSGSWPVRLFHSSSKSETVSDWIKLHFSPDFTVVVNLPPRSRPLLADGHKRPAECALGKVLGGPLLLLRKATNY
jgi:hypothetical protein